MQTQSVMPPFAFIFEAGDLGRNKLLSKIYPMEEPSYSNAKLLIIDVANENIGFLSETTPFFVSFDVDIPVEDVIDVKRFFETYRIR